MPIRVGVSFVTLHRVLVAGWLVCCLAPAGVPPARAADTVTGSIKLAQAQSPAPQAPATPAAPATDATADAQPVADEPIGNVATLTGSASVTRNNAAAPLKLKDDIFANDILQTAANSSLGVTFNDATTFNLTANSKIAIDSFVYEDGGKTNAALFDVAKGTVAFVAAAIAKTGDMKISTPTATLGIRGTTGLVEVPEGATATSRNVAIKLYPDPDGRVGRIEVNDRAGARLGFLTQGASGFTIRPGVVGGRFAAVPLTISPQQMLRDQGFVRQVHSTQNFGRQIVTQQRALRRTNPNRVAPQRQPGAQQPNAPQRQNNLRNRPGAQQPPGSPNRPSLPQRSGQPQAPGVPTQPGSPPPAAQPRDPQRLPGVQQGAPGLQRPGLQNRPLAPRRSGGPTPKRLPREIR
jgi:hypothetical protein